MTDTLVKCQKLSYEVADRGRALFPGSINSVVVRMKDGEWWNAELIAETNDLVSGCTASAINTVRISVEDYPSPEEALQALSDLLGRMKVSG